MSHHARLSDRFVADGTGRLVAQFRADGLFERGGALPQFIDTRGRVSFAAVSLDPTVLQEFDFGGDTGTVRMWRKGSIDGAERLHRWGGLRPRARFPRRPSWQKPVSRRRGTAWLLVSRDLRDFGQATSDIPSDQLPNSPTLLEKEMTVALELVEGEECWLIARLFTSATRWSPSDPMPGDGRGANVAGFDPNACGTPRAGRTRAADAGHSARVRIAPRPLVRAGGAVVGGRGFHTHPGALPGLSILGICRVARARTLNIQEAS
jgi:hypothetical protein